MTFFTMYSLIGNSVLQIRRGKRDNLEIIFHITPSKYMLYNPLFEPSDRDGSNEGLQCMFR